MRGLLIPSGPVRMLCVGAHPDDIEIGCGGTLLALAESRRVTAAFAIATGSAGRIAEATKAASRFLPAADVDVYTLGLRDGYLPASWGDLKDGLESLAGQFAPDLVFAPRRDDAHQDHRVLAELTPTVWRDSLTLHYEIPKWDGDLGPVNHYVSLGADLARRKTELLHECFSSQVDRDWWDDETFLGLMRLRGIECRSRYAEGFIADKAVLSMREDTRSE